MGLLSFLTDTREFPKYLRWLDVPIRFGKEKSEDPIGIADIDLEEEGFQNFDVKRIRTVRNGFEVTAILTDGDFSRTKVFFTTSNNERTIAGKLEKMFIRFQEKNLIVPDIQMMKSEVEELLINKGYLVEGQTLDDLPDKRDL